MPSNIAVIVPARFRSSRFPGKALAPLRGASGLTKPLIQRSWECAAGVAGPDKVWIATDDVRIADACTAFGGQVVMTPEACRNGTERCAAALDQLDPSIDLVLNVQGDALLTPLPILQGLVERMDADRDLQVTTPSVPLAAAELSRFRALEAEGRAGGTSLVTDRHGAALYFSKKLIPYIPADFPADRDPPVRLHLGVYAYRRAALEAYRAAEPSELEILEGLEQLRFLDLGIPVQTVPFGLQEWDCVELNNPEDAPVIEAILAARGMD